MSVQVSAALIKITDFIYCIKVHVKTCMLSWIHFHLSHRISKPTTGPVSPRPGPVRVLDLTEREEPRSSEMKGSVLRTRSSGWTLSPAGLKWTRSSLGSDLWSRPTCGSDVCFRGSKWFWSERSRVCGSLSPLITLIWPEDLNSSQLRAESHV